MSKFDKKPIVGLLAAVLLAFAVAPAAAQPWGPPPPPPPGWGPPPPPPPPGWRPHHRHHCWTEARRVRVWTDDGPRWRTRYVRVCR